MALTGEAKRLYQREYMRRKRSNTGGSNTGLTTKPVGLTKGSNALDNLRQIIKDIENKEPVKPKQVDVKPNLPIYNPAIHRAGDKVLIQQGKRLIPTIVPSIDADGHPY